MLLRRLYQLRLSLSHCILFCLCIQLLLCYSTALPDPATTPSVPAASSTTRPHARRHCGTPQPPVAAAAPSLSRWKFCWTAVCPQSLRNWSHRKIRIAEKLLNRLIAAVNKQTCWNVTAYIHVEQLKLMTVPPLFHKPVVIINWHTAGQIEDNFLYTIII